LMLTGPAGHRAGMKLMRATNNESIRMVASNSWFF
jgi:hypothetical protein